MEKYLNKCLDSLIVANMDLLEVLVINDGSKDNSSQIAHKYSTKYPNTFRVIDKENGNYGSCINRGLKEATGKYIKVLDADDSFNSIHLCLFLDLLKGIDVDLILTDYVIVDENDKETKLGTYSIESDVILNFNNSISIIAHNIQMHSVTYKRENILNLNYKQSEGISYTDQEWIFIPITTVNKIIYYKLPLYRYLVGREGQTMDTIVMNKSISHLYQVLRSMISDYSLYKQCDIKRQYLYDRMYSYLSYIYRRTILSEQSSNSLFIEMDDFVKDSNIILYKNLEELNLSRIIRFKFVKYWHNTRKEIPFIINLLYKILH